jgi:MFS family permease
MVGLVVFTGASLACGLAPNGGSLIGARVVRARRRIDEPGDAVDHRCDLRARERGKAIGIWASVFGDGACDRPLVGSLLTEHINWNWIFFINVPIGITA